MFQDLLTDIRYILGLKREHVSSLLNGSENATPRGSKPVTPADDYEKDFLSPDYDEI